MKKISFILLVFCFGVTGTFISLYGEEEIHFSNLLSGRKIISPAGAYETGKSDFNTPLTGFLDKLGNFLNNNPGLVIEVGGHSDNSGTPRINQILSTARAQRVKEYLVKKSGIGEGRILVKGYSSGLPIADNRTNEGRTRNRRVEIVALKNVDPAGRVTYIRRDVFTKSKNSTDFTRASRNQGLYHLDRVLTRKKSNANVTFQDLSRINLGPQSLMVMYSLVEKGFRAPRKQNVGLLTGGLRTKLNKLKGALKVETPACIVNSNSVEILIGIDEKKMSSLSVFDGQSEVKAGGKTVDVPGGYGTVVEKGEAPAPPEPLPPAPRLLKPLDAKIYLKTGSDTIPVQFQWHRSEDSYHFQVATDSQFEKIIADQVVHADTVSLSLGTGTYYWRTAAVNKRGIEGYAAASSFISSKELPELPLEITPKPEEAIETSRRALTVSGKTLPGSRININGDTIGMNSSGAFTKRISLRKGWNYIKIRAFHPGFKEKYIWLTVYRPTLSQSGLTLGFHFDHGIKDNRSYDTFNTYGIQFGKTFTLTSRFEGEFSAGFAGMFWANYPGNYKKSVLAIPLTVELHLMLFKGAVTPYLSTGLAAYVAFPEKRGENTKETKLFISPEIGAGLSFPIAGITSRFEVKYRPFLKKEPFFLEMTNRLAFILKIIF